MAKPKFITQKALKAYLKQHPKKKFYRFDPDSCPVAEAMGKGCIAGWTFTYVFPDPQKEEMLLLKTPQWAAKFMMKFDDCDRLGNPNNERSEAATGAEALRILEESLKCA